MNGLPDASNSAVLGRLDERSRNVQRRAASIAASAARTPLRLKRRLPSVSLASPRPMSTLEGDYAFEMATSSIRYGEGVTREVGQDMKEMGARHVCVMTDASLLPLHPVQTVLESLRAHGVKFSVYSNVRVEPSDASFQAAIAFAMSGDFDAYIAVGGGSVIDTCKAANLYATHQPPPDPAHPELPYDFLYYVNPPLGKGRPPPGPLKPLIAVPTTVRGE